MNKHNDKLLNHFLNPKNVGSIENPDGFARVINPVNGYTTDIYIRIENDRIVLSRFKSIGCTATIAISSAITELIKDKIVQDFINKNDYYIYLMDLINNELGNVPDKNWHCLPTAVMGVFKALLSYYIKQDDKETIEKLKNIIYKIDEFIQQKLNE